MSYPPPRYDTPTPDPAIPYSQPRSGPSLQLSRRPFTSRSDSRKPLLEELIPTVSPEERRDNLAVLRRTGSLAIISIFLLSTVFLAITEGKRKLENQSLRLIFGAGSQAEVGNAWLGNDLNGGDGIPDWQGAQPGHGMPPAPEQNARPKVDFEKYTMLRTLPPASVDTTDGKRLIFIGDIHGSYEPLLRLMGKISYDSSKDLLIHVGDLIAKGKKHEEVLQWMNHYAIMGVRGNHDQPVGPGVIQWRTWMEWAGGDNWESYIDDLASAEQTGVIGVLTKDQKMFPKGWEWKGEHWQIARDISATSYEYLLRLPLTLHVPSLHTFIVHAGLLPSDPTKSSYDDSQPLIQASDVANASANGATYGRTSEELQILFNVPQNSVPWNLLNIRSVRMKGKHRGEVTKSSKKGKPWSDIWKKEMRRCKGPGSWLVEGMGETEVESELSEEDGAIEINEDVEVDEEGVENSQRDDDEEEPEPGRDLKCSPVTVIYGHAAGRGLDIKPYSKGIDTGCVYGKQLTVLVLGNTDGLKGQQVRVGDMPGILVHENCEEGGL